MLIKYINISRRMYLLKKNIKYIFNFFSRIKNFLFLLKDLSCIIERIEFLEKNIIIKSKLFDYKYYNETYQYNFSKFEAVDSWYKNWKINNENPSKFINVAYCKNRINNINPILCYLSYGKERLFSANNRNSVRNNECIYLYNKYQTLKRSRKSKSVVYTCITNDYDDIFEIDIYNYIDYDWDYVCFTDNKYHIAKSKIGIWDIRPLQFDNLDHTRNNRWHKIHPHIIFPEYKESIYIDANINILSNYLFKIVKEKNKNIIIPEHFKNICIFSEYTDVLLSRLDDSEIVYNEMKYIISQGMIKNYGLTENNIIYRKHHDKKIINIMEHWWKMVENFSKRDQLSLSYILWKNNIIPNDISFTNIRFLINDFYIWNHKK